MDILYILIAIVVVLAGYSLITNWRKDPEATGEHRKPAPRMKRPATAASGESRNDALEEDGGDPQQGEEQAPPGTRTPAVSPRAEAASSGQSAGAEPPEEPAANDPPCPCGSGASFRHCHGAEDLSDPESARPATSPQDSTAENEQRARFQYCDHTVLYYEPSHGNQIVYHDRNGTVYLWYPGNSIILAGNWRVEGQYLYFRYGANTYNPVTHEHGGHWERIPLTGGSIPVIDAVPGDPLELSTGFPYRLPAHPRFRSVLDARRDPVSN